MHYEYNKLLIAVWAVLPQSLIYWAEGAIPKILKGHFSALKLYYSKWDYIIISLSSFAWVTELREPFIPQRPFFNTQIIL